jgi:ankyrin repeat protein
MIGSGVGNNNQHGGAVSSKANAISAAASADAFLESRATSVDARDDKGRTALHFASRMKSAECVRLLVEAGADPNARDKEGFTPLHMAAGYGRAECATLLLEHGETLYYLPRKIIAKCFDL